MHDGETNALLTLLLTPGLGHRLIRRSMEVFGSAKAVLGADATALGSVRGIGADRAVSFRRSLDQLIAQAAAQEERALADRHGTSLIRLDEPSYPRLLKLTADPPLLLYVQGQMIDDDGLALAIVGSRNCSHYGREQADRLAAGCAAAGLCIVSGGAIGIDAAAHQAALRCGGRTIAIIGSGLANPYPKRHRDLFESIARDRGAVVSEFPMQMAPLAENFPRRNRIISGLSLGVLVVEAAVRSGALITARICVEEHGRECMVLPGRVDAPSSGGCHKLIRDGAATLVTSAAEIFDALGETGHLIRAGIEPPAGEQARSQPLLEQRLSHTQRRILEKLDQPLSMDQLVGATGLQVPVIQADLTMLQIRGLVGRDHSSFTRKS